MEPYLPHLPAAAGLVSLGAWLFLWLGRGGFWRIRPEEAAPEPERWPAVTAVIPARDEAEVIGQSLASLWAQRYPGRLRVVVVDDQSEDGTADAALAAARAARQDANLRLLSAGPRPPGWTGKVWALHQGVTRGVAPDDPARYLLLTDADILHGEGSLRRLAARAEADGCDLVSLMVRLRCAGAAEKLMIPAFVFFFRLLYPFRRVNDPGDRTAGAAGGVMLVRRQALARIGGLERIRGELIDDCALAREIKAGGHRIRLELSHDSRSLRGYGTLGEILRMVARTAYTQLRRSPARLLGCAAGLGLAFLIPPALLFSGSAPAAAAGVLAWGVMTALYAPMARFYGLSPLWAPLLPLTALLYLAATLLSAWEHYRGRGGWWKGRSQAGE